MNLTNKVVWITGASSGIGEALAAVFAQEGCRLVLSARREHELLRVKGNLPSNTSVLILPMDMLAMDSFQDLTTQVIAHFGQIDIVVHNAGISQRELLVNTAPQDVRRLMDTNFTSVVTLTQCVLPYMLQRQTGAFLVTSSVSGKVGTPFRTIYAASKHAIQGFFDGLRGEVYKQHIQITIACLGYVKTNLSYNAIGKNGKPYNKMDEKQANGIDPNVCATKMVKALKAGKHEIIIAGFMESLGAFLKRFAPSILWLFTKNYNIKSI
jgi:dehydrogenase/reductase SDR family member 7